MTPLLQTFRRFRILLLGIVILGIIVYFTRNLIYREEEQKDAIRRIRDRGYLLALTDKNTMNYYISKGEPMGYQLELLQSFSRSLGVPFRIIASKDVSRLRYYLDNNVADIIALNLPVTREGKKLVHFTQPFGETRLVLIQRRAGKDKLIRQLKELASGDTIYARENVFMTGFYSLFGKQTGNHPFLLIKQDITDEELVEQVSEGLIRFAICPENIVMVYKRYFGNIDSYVITIPLYTYAWAVNHNSDTLLMKMNEWLSQVQKDGSLKKTYLTYFDNQKIVTSLRSDYVSLRGSRMSPFDRDIRTMSRWIRWDWRLLASLVYQESSFLIGQTSSRSAKGLMQLIPETAAKMGMDSLSSPSQQLSAGVRYLRHLNGLLPDSIIEPKERISFILASYNVGIGRILAARQKAIRYGKDPNRWHGSVDYYLLRKSRTDPHNIQDSTGDFPGDYKTEGFVDDILNRYYHYKNLIPE